MPIPIPRMSGSFQAVSRECVLLAGGSLLHLFWFEYNICQLYTHNTSLSIVHKIVSLPGLVIHRKVSSVGRLGDGLKHLTLVDSGLFRESQSILLVLDIISVHGRLM